MVAQFSPLQSIGAFQSGQAQKEKRDRRSLLQEVGGQAAAGDIGGAQQTALKAGAFDLAAEVNKFTPEQINQVEVFGKIADVYQDARKNNRPWGPEVSQAIDLLPPAERDMARQALGNLKTDADVDTLFNTIQSLRTSPEMALKRETESRLGQTASAQNLEAMVDPQGNRHTLDLTDPAQRQFAIDNDLRPAPVRTQVETGDPGAFTGAAAPTAVLSAALKTIDNADLTLGMISDFRDVLTTENIGAVGAIRRVAQGAAEQAKALAPALDAQRNEILNDIVDSGSDVSTALFMVDEDLAQAELLEVVLAYRFAKMMDPGGRVAKDDLKAAQSALGANKFLTGEVSIGAKLDAFEKMVNRQRAVASRRAAQEQPAQLGQQPQGQLAAPQIATNPTTGQKIQFNEQTQQWEPVQ